MEKTEFPYSHGLLRPYLWMSWRITDWKLLRWVLRPHLTFRQRFLSCREQSIWHMSWFISIFANLAKWPDEITSTLWEGEPSAKKQIVLEIPPLHKLYFFTNNLIMWFIKNTMSVWWDFWLIQDQDNLDHYAKWVWLIKLKILNHTQIILISLYNCTQMHPIQRDFNTTNLSAHTLTC